jgi:hypothetical protein
MPTETLVTNGDPTAGYGNPSQRSPYSICTPRISLSWISCTNRKPRRANLVRSPWWSAACRLCRKIMLQVRIIWRETGAKSYSSKENSDLLLRQHIRRANGTHGLIKLIRKRDISNNQDVWCSAASASRVHTSFLLLLHILGNQKVRHWVSFQYRNFYTKFHENWTTVPPKRQLTFNGLHGVVSLKIAIIITTAVRTSNPTCSLYNLTWRFAH